MNDAKRPVYMWSNNKVQPGDIRYKDVNEDGYINNDDQVAIGYSNFPEKYSDSLLEADLNLLTSLFYCRVLAMLQYLHQDVV